MHIDIHSDNSNKSMADMRLGVHALEAAQRTAGTTSCLFAIVSNDSDFLPLIGSLKSLGRRVALVTFNRASGSITDAADLWIQLPKRASSTGQETTNPPDPQASASPLLQEMFQHAHVAPSTSVPGAESASHPTHQSPPELGGRHEQVRTRSHTDGPLHNTLSTVTKLGAQ